MSGKLGAEASFFDDEFSNVRPVREPVEKRAPPAISAKSSSSKSSVSSPRKSEPNPTVTKMTVAISSEVAERVRRAVFFESRERFEPFTLRTFFEQAATALADQLEARYRRRHGTDYPEEGGPLRPGRPLR